MPPGKRRHKGDKIVTAQQTYTNVCKKLWAYFGGEAPAAVVPADEDLALGVFAGLYREGFRLAGKRVHILGAGSFADALAACLENGGAAGVTVGDSDDGIVAEGAAGETSGNTASETTPGGAAYYIRLAGAEEPALARLTGAEGVCDLTVLPLRSQLLLDAEEADFLTSGGVYPLAAAVGIVRGRILGTAPAPSEIEEVVRRYLRGVSDIAVTGLRGDGASAVAEALSRLTRRPLVRVGRGNVAEAFTGATGRLFLLEEGVAADPAALATVVGNGRCVFVAPPLDTLKEGGGDPARAARYRSVLGIYTAFCDRTYEHTGDPQDTARRIWDDFLRAPYLKRSK